MYLLGEIAGLLSQSPAELSTRGSALVVLRDQDLTGQMSRKWE